MKIELKKSELDLNLKPLRSQRNLIVLTSLLALMLSSACTVKHVNTTSVTHYFPVGSSSNTAETAWRVGWTFLPHPEIEGEEIWVINKVDFMRGWKMVNGQREKDWIRVLNQMAVAAMFVPYVKNSHRFRDFFQYYTGLSQLDKTAVSKRAYRPTYIHGKRIVRETTDDFVRWIETGPNGYHGTARVKRGQAVTLWGMFSAVNYVYPMSFKFRDDGVIQVRIAASGQNLRDQPTLLNTHLHIGSWRLEPSLCGLDNNGCQPEDVVIQKVSRRAVSGQEEMVFESFNSGMEGGQDWLANEFTALLLSNPNQPNSRPIPCSVGQTGPCLSNEPVGYSLVPIRYGNARFRRGPQEGFLDHDLWVTRKPSPPALAEIFYTEIQDYANNQSLPGYPKVVWYKSAYNHIPRYEDLGIGSGSEFDKNEGIALTNYTGFDLVPRNLMFSTPTYTP